MAIEITKRPFYYCFSGNPVHYELYSDQAAADTTISFEVKVLFSQIGGNYVETPEFPYTPVNGFAEVDVRDMLEGFLEYSLPGFDNNEQKVWEATGQTGMFYIKYREISSLNNDPTWDESEQDFACFVIKGGISFFKYQGNNFFANYFNADTPNWPRPFLTWQQSGRLAAITERMYLALLVIDDVAGITVIAKAFYTDGSTQQLSADTPVDRNKIYYIPSGATQWGFSTVKQLWYWEIFVQAFGSVNLLSQTFRYYADNRNDYNDLTLQYRNSLGGLDSVRIRGVIKDDLDYDYQELQKTVRPDYFDKHFFEPQKTISGNKEIQTHRGDIGHLEKEEQDRMRDAFLKRETWWAQNRKWVPVNIVTKNLTQRTTESTRWSMPIDFTLGFDGDINYTPDSVDLGSGVFTENVCKARLTPLTLTVDLSGSDAAITVDGTEVDPQDASESFRYRVLDEDGFVVMDWTRAMYSDLPLNFTRAKEHVYTLEVQAICTNTIFGRKVTSQIDTRTSSGGGGGGPMNSILMNQVSSGTPYEVRVNGTDISSGYIGANNSAPFNAADAASATVAVILPYISPSNAKLSSGGINYSPVSIAGNVVTFTGVNITGGMVIQIF